MDIVNILKIISGIRFFEDYSRVSKPRLVDYSLFIPSLILVYLTQRLLIPIFKAYGTKKYIKNSGQDFANDERMFNYAQRLYSGLFHAISTIMCFLFFYRRTWWFPNCGVLAVTFTYDIRYDFSIRLYYNIESSYVIYKSISLIYERYILGVKKEFVEMFIHHITTTLLVLVSYFTMYAYHGVLVFFLHNLTDVFTYLCRCHADIRSKYSVVFLPLCIISWIVLRLFMFPVFVIGNASVKAIALENIKNHHIFFTPFLTFLLVVLYCLHTYWVYGLCRILYSVVTNGYQQKVEEASVPLKSLSNHSQEEEVEEMANFQVILEEEKEGGMDNQKMMDV